MARPDYPALEEEMARSYPRQNAVIPEYRSYDALESRQGVMLFSRTTEGQRQRREYEHRLELNFYNPHNRRPSALLGNHSRPGPRGRDGGPAVRTGT